MGHLQLSEKQYLKHRRGKGRSGYRWYVRIGVPSDLRETLRKRTIERALDTSDFKEAQKRRYAVVAEIFADFDRARLHTITSADIEHEAQLYLRERFRLARSVRKADVAGVPELRAVVYVLRGRMGDGQRVINHGVTRALADLTRGSRTLGAHVQFPGPET